MTDAAGRRRRFAALHAGPGTFVLPNPWDVGSARLLEHLGFDALATTSAGLAWALGREDQSVTRDELLAHVRTLVAAVDVPLHVDAERGYADDPAGVGETVALLLDAGAAGCSIEDYDPSAGGIAPLDAAVERVAAAADAARQADAPLVLTARCENHLYGVDDLDDTVARLRAYAAAGADCVYAPGLRTVAEVETVVRAVDVPVNVLAWPDGPSVPQLAAAGVRRVSTGSALASAAYGALATAARELQQHGTTTFRAGGLTAADRAALR
ncbi:isocitrate lyase/PEP mutase family protein [Cellulomonas fimi]|uniref:PEP phosphonomutase n=1 Tax=Cellulomonas fimi (strain ATCC 484 / DSM 20113 / JCM 1341 / CCUG 24087 / LMG 16345 / NBRC 15513 / NCIMB 8980 / NCTC 7547 / NRS-133) TaxID=590998 RepID=F4H3D9_CELFA|nr:isocitrate lyase/phosphoenolpyruvate mutase family protein [Cellulomonas fimi]AEE46484.1 PEP phosphonomutase [Cellulomonas fimi ATCC 484]NNH08238.1 isocitrate lyase/phosphoenolpyruvate mutase family protein [Cellulomonas fimi]VEH33177.1 Carboxyvinyl-carboxyphosphonate phosphorylmutase [Cellulomonas fimi]